MHLSRLRVVLTLLVITLVLYASVRAATTKVDAAFASVALGPRMEVLEDASGWLDFAAVRASAGFKPAPEMGTKFGFSRSAWWVRFTVDNPDDTDRQVLLRQDYPLIDYLDVWAQDRGGEWHDTATSVGVASTRDRNFENVDEMFRAADGALYQAKDLGRNRVVRFAV